MDAWAAPRYPHSPARHSYLLDSPWLALMGSRRAAAWRAVFAAGGSVLWGAMSWEAKSLSSLVASHGRQLMKFFVSRLPDSGEAPDLVQEVYLRLLRLQEPDLIRLASGEATCVATNFHQDALSSSEGCAS